jgi:glycosyltransferase involved in cell wall biosynthesis
MRIAPDTAVVMTTHDGELFVARQIESILNQSLLPAAVTIVDDASRDNTLSIIRDVASAAPVPIDLVRVDGSRHRNAKTRVAESVIRGLDSVAHDAGVEFVLLSDQDDEWLPGRLESQRELLRSRSDALLVAADALLIDASGAAMGGNLRDRFPIPEDWERLDPAQRVRAAIRRPFVTGATCAMRRELIPLIAPVPPGWLFDRWATLVAASRDGLVLQPDPVIRYRIHAGQVTGIRDASTGAGRRRWRQTLARGATPIEAVRKAHDIVQHIRPLAVERSVRNELSWRSLIRAAAGRVEA